MPIIATTINNSISVKPAVKRVLLSLKKLLKYLFFDNRFFGCVNITAIFITDVGNDGHGVARHV